MIEEPVAVVTPHSYLATTLGSATSFSFCCCLCCVHLQQNELSRECCMLFIQVRFSAIRDVAELAFFLNCRMIDVFS